MKRQSPPPPPVRRVPAAGVDPSASPYAHLPGTTWKAGGKWHYSSRSSEPSVTEVRPVPGVSCVVAIALVAIAFFGTLGLMFILVS